MPKKKQDSEMVTCGRCGLSYKAGAPHAAFCRGNIPDDASCTHCGNDDKEFLLECTCGEIICECCKEDGTHVCD